MKSTDTGPGTRARSSLLRIGFAASALIWGATGCGPTGPGMAQVSGKVTYKDKAVPKGTITFIPVAPEGRNATGTIGPDGTYRLQTENPNDGAILGDYLVTISARDDEVLDYIPRVPVPPKLLVPEKYEKPQDSGLKATVHGGSNTLNFDLAD